jgi:alkanesulfonate monooxygenase SsuD/methylene tetrahydromethanopterin reductase-like flavin-dependent oxidoreductase (luciferase family)
MESPSLLLRPEFSRLKRLFRSSRECGRKTNHHLKADTSESAKAVNEPKPIQKPHPPVWLGARRGKMLGLVARYADGWNNESVFTPHMFKRKVTVLEEQCKDAVRDVNQIRESIVTDIIIGKTRVEVDELVKECSACFNMRAEECVEKRIVATPEQVAERL